MPKVCRDCRLARHHDNRDTPNRTMEKTIRRDTGKMNDSRMGDVVEEFYCIVHFESNTS